MGSLQLGLCLAMGSKAALRKVAFAGILGLIQIIDRGHAVPMLNQVKRRKALHGHTDATPTAHQQQGENASWTRRTAVCRSSPLPPIRSLLNLLLNRPLSPAAASSACRS